MLASSLVVIATINSLFGDMMMMELPLIERLIAEKKMAKTRSAHSLISHQLLLIMTSRTKAHIPLIKAIIERDTALVDKILKDSKHIKRNINEKDSLGVSWILRSPARRLRMKLSVTPLSGAHESPTAMKYIRLDTVCCDATDDRRPFLPPHRIPR